jgi:hypothetical protein
LVHFIFTGAQIIERYGWVDHFCFFARPDEKSRFPVFGLLLEIKKTQISQSPTQNRLLLCHASWFSFLFHGGHTNVDTISRNFYPLFEKSSWPPYVEKLLLAFCLSKWKLQRKQIPKNFGLFGTFWTMVVENPSFSEWHFD